jgi:hypothetical protein
MHRFSTTNQERQMPQKRKLIDKTTGPAATEQFGGGAEKFGWEKESRASSEHIASILAGA